MLTDGVSDWFGLVLPRNEHQVDWDAGQNHQAAIACNRRSSIQRTAIAKIKLRTCFDWTSNHGYDSNKNTADDVEEGEEKVDFEGPGQVGLRVAQHWQTHHCNTYAQLQQKHKFDKKFNLVALKKTDPGGEADVVDESENVRNTQVQHGENSLENHILQKRLKFRPIY